MFSRTEYKISAIHFGIKPTWKTLLCFSGISVFIAASDVCTLREKTKPE